MDLRIDEKGKYYTQRVTKDTLPVFLRTVDHSIAGYIHIRPERRLKDELDANRSPFIALTEATVYDENGHTYCYQTEVLFVALHQIITITPLESMGEFAQYTWLQHFLEQSRQHTVELLDEDAP